MIGKTFILCDDPNVVNEIINHSDIKPFVSVDCNDDWLDVTELFKNGAIAVLTMDKNGGAVLVPNAEKKEMEGHTFAKKEARGKAVMEACRDGAYFILKECGCERMVGYNPIDNKVALAFNKKIGFEVVGETEKDRGSGLERVIEVERLK